MSKLRPKFTYANVAATLALVLSMSGGALAAGHYLINSKKQINPKVLNALEGAKGPRGATGAAGATGSAGATGATGLEGKRGQDGPKGTGGLTGESGGTGPAGATGTTGLQGATGPTGATGETGSEGKAGGEGKRGSTGEQGATGERGPTGLTGASGENGDALAYAHVSEEGDLSEAKNVGTVTEHSAGVFCLSGIVGAIHNVEATIDANETESFEDSLIRAATGHAGKLCPEGTQVTVETSVASEVTNGSLEEEEVAQGFFVTIN